MDPIEKAIRNAFDKGNAEDRPFREKVYRSAFAALDRAIKANPALTVEVAIQRRRNLQAKIASIESEFLAAVAAPHPPRPDGTIPPPMRPDHGHPAPAPFVEPPVSPPPRSSASVHPVPPDVQPGRVVPVVPDIMPDAPVAPAPSLDFGAEPALAGSPEMVEVAPDRNDARLRERRRPYAAMLLAVTLISAAAIGGWWAYRTGLITLPADTGPVPNPPQIVEGEDFAPEEGVPPPTSGDTAPPREWINVFSPDDPSVVNAPSGATAEVMEDESGSFLRIRSGSGGAAVVFDVGQGILEQIAGKKAVFDIVARAEEGKETQISVSCDFGELGDCGRKRYEVGYERGEYLLNVQLPAKSPGAAGSIAVNSDFANQGKAVDIYEIRVSVE